MKKVTIVLCLVLLFHEGITQSTSSLVDKKDLKKFVKILTSDSLEGRGTGTAGQKKAARFIANRFQKLGLNTYSESGYYEKFELTETYLGEVSIETAQNKLYNFDKMVCNQFVVKNFEGEKEVVFGGWGTEEELDQIDVTDRFVLIFLKNLRADYLIRQALKKRKAFGVIMANPGNEKQFESIRRTLKDHSLRKSYYLKNRDLRRGKSFDSLLKNSPVKVVKNSFVIATDQIGNISGLPIRELNKLISTKRLADAPVQKIKITYKRIYNQIATENVIGVLKGKTNKTIVISAHYDHLGRANNHYYPGADDNASGVSGMLELAEQFSSEQNLNYNIMFLATTAEEAGLLGSVFHVNQPGFEDRDILYNINLDMISRKDEDHKRDDYLYCLGTDQSEVLHQLVEKADASYDACSFDFSLNNTSDPLGIYTRSDNYSFYKKGIPSIFFFSGLHEDYHKETDVASKINFKNLESRVRLIAKVIEMLQDEEPIVEMGNNGE